MYRLSLILLLCASSVFAQTKIREGNQTMGALPTAQGGAPAGGTTGQALKKNSNTDYDYSWGAVGTSLIFADSIVNTAGTVTLVNDSATPGNSKYYGTDSGGTLGYFSVPTTISGAALTKVDDTNITLTLGGSPNTALVNAASITVGWTGTLAVGRGGTGVSSLGNLTDAGTDGIVVTGGTGSVITNTSLAQHVADATHNGYLSSTDWNTFTAGAGGGTVTSITATAPIVVTPSPITTTGVISITGSNLTDAGTDGIVVTGGTGAVLTTASLAQHVADTSHNGYLSSTDWNTFNGKSTVTPAALTKTDDTNVTLTLGGTPATALLQATSLTLGWTGTLAASRGGTGVSSLGDLTKGDDTNVTLTLGGTPTGALITSASITAGWTGTLSLARGGTAAALVDPNADTLMGWDDTDGAIKFLTIGTGLTYTHATHTLSSSASTTAGGSDTQVQFNDGGTAFGGDSDFTWNKTTNVLTDLGTIDLGNADTSLARNAAGILGVEGVAVPTISSTHTLTNKRVTKRALSTSGPGATPTINTDNYDVAHFTAVAAAITSMTTNLTGTPVQGDQLRIDFTDDGTARAITWGASFVGGAVALPTTTLQSVRLDTLFYWDTVQSKWACMANSQLTPTTATGGSLTNNSVVLGAGGQDMKVVAGVITDGTSKLTLGVAGTSVGSVDFKNATSGTITLSPVTGALGTVTLSLPAATDTLMGKATTDTETNKTLTSPTLVTPALGTPASGVMTNVTGTADGLTAGDVTRNHAVYAGASPPTVDVGMFTISKTGVDLKTAGTTTVFTVPAGRAFICMGAYARVTSVTSGGAGTESFQIKESGGSGIMSVNAASGSGTPVAGKYYASQTTNNGGAYTECAAGNAVQVVVATSQAGSTAVTGTVFVQGFYSQ